MDDLGFLAISDSLEHNLECLDHTLNVAELGFRDIGMSFNPDKCDLQHFSWCRKYKPLKLVTRVNGTNITIPAELHQVARILLQQELTFKDHVKIMALKGRSIVNGLSCLGNTIHGLSPYHTRLLFTTCVIPVLTYGCQLWFRKDTPNKGLIYDLQMVQNEALRRITGTFRTTPTEALHLLSFIPPIECTIAKLSNSAALRIFRFLCIPKFRTVCPSLSFPLPSPESRSFAKLILKLKTLLFLFTFPLHALPLPSQEHAKDHPSFYVTTLSFY